jgi:hypothetical protein
MPIAGSKRCAKRHRSHNQSVCVVQQVYGIGIRLLVIVSLYISERLHSCLIGRRENFPSWRSFDANRGPSFPPPQRQRLSWWSTTTATTTLHNNTTIITTATKQQQQWDRLNRANAKLPPSSDCSKIKSAGINRYGQTDILRCFGEFADMCLNIFAQESPCL